MTLIETHEDLNQIQNKLFWILNESDHRQIFRFKDQMS
jgi:hypothetical protein